MTTSQKKILRYIRWIIENYGYLATGAKVILYFV